MADKAIEAITDALRYLLDKEQERLCSLCDGSGDWSYAGCPVCHGDNRREWEKISKLLDALSAKANA